jgi:hypothetical protein
MLVDSYKVGILDVVNTSLESKGYSVPVYATKGELTCQFNNEMVDYLVDGWRTNEPKYADKYISFPPRFALGCRANVESDRRLKIAKWNDYKDAIMEMKPRMTSIGRELAFMWVEEVYENMTYDPRHVEQYVMNHKGSKFTKGVTWLDQWKDDKMMELFNFTREFVDMWYEDFFLSGDWCLSASTINYGSRARSPDLIFTSYQEFLLERTRQIGFREGPSSVNAFVNHETQIKIMRTIFDVFEKRLNCKIYSPKTEGGWVYHALRDAYLAGKQLKNYDVAGMEIITPSIINGSIGNFILGIGAVIGYMGDIPELLSGVGPTSDWDMLAHLILLEDLLVKPPEFIVILGDDCTMVGGEIRSSPLYERQPRDEYIHRTLGLTTTDEMHPVGLNITVDTAEKRMTLNTPATIFSKGEYRSIEVATTKGMQSKWYDNKMEESERWKIIDYFLGKMQGRPNYEVIKNIKPQEHVYSPREQIERAIGLTATT